MSRNILCLLVGAVLLVQASNAVPIPREEIEDYVFFETAKFMKDILLEGRNLFRNIKEKATKSEPKSAELSGFLEEFNQIIKQISDLSGQELNPKDTEGIFKLFDKFYDTLRRYKDADFPAEISAKENGYEALKAFYKESFEKLSEKLIARVGQYIDGLSSEQKETGDSEKLIDWFEEFKAKATTRTYADLGPLLELFD